MLHLSDVEILARTIYGEARGEYEKKTGGLPSLIAVGNVVMNRVSAKTWFGNSVREVCLKPWQFSCWNKNDPNYIILRQPVLKDPLYNLCSSVAFNLCAGKWPDLTKGSDHYHAVSLPAWPKWSSGQKPHLIVGGHAFYKLEGN